MRGEKFFDSFGKNFVKKFFHNENVNNLSKTSACKFQKLLNYVLQNIRKVLQNLKCKACKCRFKMLVCVLTI